jgi:N-glycosylase/DNA lyase
LEAFPVDTWILKTLASRYGLAGWRPAQVAQFGRAHFGPLAGLAQQFLFAYERAAAGRSNRHGKK